MPTLAEYEKLTNTDDLVAGIFDEILTENELTPFLQFESFEGSAYAYNRESTLPAATTHQIGDDWVDTEGTKDRKTTKLSTVGVQSPLDRSALQTRSSVQSQETIVVSDMAKSLSRKIAQMVITGEPENISTEFEGLDSLCRLETRMMAMDDGDVNGPGTNETEVTLDRFDAFTDMIEGGKPDAYIMNKTMRRKLTALSRVSGSGVVMGEIEMFGHKVRTYDHIPILINDWITNAEIYNNIGTWPSSSATTIFAAMFGREKQGYTLIHNGEVLNPDLQFIGIKERKNENLYRMVVYVQGIVYSTLKIAALGGIDSQA